MALWVSVSTHIADDKRVRKIANAVAQHFARNVTDNVTLTLLVTGHVTGSIVRLWARGMSEHPNGELFDWDHDDIAHYSGIGIDARAWVNMLVEHDILEVMSAESFAFSDRAELMRMDKLAKNNAERQRRFRERTAAKNRNVTSNVTVTPDRQTDKQTKRGALHLAAPFDESQKIPEETEFPGNYDAAAQGHRDKEAAKRLLGIT